MSVVSCTSFDDTELQEAINDLQNRVAALETAVAENVAAIQSMVSLGSVQSVSIDQETGKVVITLTDGKKLTVDMTGYSLITVEKDENGEYYWAICVDGVSTPLTVDGKTVPVAVTPALRISEQNEWQISVDGGKTWVSTGIFTQEGGAPSIFNDVKQDGDTLILTLADGTEIKVAVLGEFKFAAAETSVYFSKQAKEKTVALEFNNVKAYTITEKPEGWKARVENEDENYSLVITSPSDMSSAMTSGTVKILGLYNAGTCSEIISVDVTFEDAFKLSAGVGGVAKVTVAEHSFEDIDGYIVGAVKATDFDAEAVAAWLNTEEGYMTEPYREAMSFQVSEMVEDYDATEAYVVYAVEHLPVMQMVSGAASYSKEDIKHIVLGSTKAKAGISNVRYDSAYLSLEFKDLTGYFGGFSSLGFWESMGMANALESINVGNMTPMTAPTYEGQVCLFPDGVEGTQILPATDYLVWIVPKSESEDYTYTEEDFIIYSFTSAPIVADNSIAAPVCEVTDVTYGGFSAKVTPAAGAYKTYAAIRKTSALPEDELELVTEIIDINQFSEGTEALEISSNSFSADDEVCIVAVTLTEDGRYGKLYKKVVPLKTLEYSDAMSVSASAKVHGLGDVTVTLTFSGNPSTVTYYCTNSNYFGDETMQDMLARGQVGNAVIDMNISELTDGNKIELTGLTLGVEHSFYVLVKNTDGVPSRMTKISIMPMVMIDYVLSSNKSYSYGKPTVSGTKSGSKYTLNVTKPAECVKYWFFMGDFEYMTGSSTVLNITDEYAATDKLVTMQLEDVGALELDADYSTVYTSLRATTRIYIAWLDDKGAYHAVYTTNPNK